MNLKKLRASAEVALAHVINNPRALIISAQTLSDMNGIKLLGKMQHIFPDVALILLSDAPDRPAPIKDINNTKY